MSFRWRMVVVAVLGLMVGPGPITVFAFSVFMKPITQDLGISREMITLAIVFSAPATLLNPVLGGLIDRYGTRRTLLSIIPFFAVGLVGFSFMTPLYLQIALTFLFVHCVSLSTGPTGYAALVARWFDRERGLALGVAMAGVGLGAALIPPLSAFLISQFGWRAAYRCLAVVVLLFAWLPAWFIRDPRQPSLAQLADARPDGSLRGVGLIAALKGWRFWALTAAFFLSVVAVNGTVIHTVPMLTDRGVSLALATTAVSVNGLCIIFGRILSGWCLDRYPGPIVAICFFVFPMLGIILLGEGGGVLVPIVGAAMCGLSVGAEIDLMAFFVSRYFGVMAYGRVYGAMFCLFAAGNGIGAFIGGYSHTHFGGYGPALIVFEVALVATCLLFLPLGPYPYPAPKRIHPAGVAKAAA